MKFFSLTSTALVSILLAGCFEFEHRFHVNNDKTVSIETTYQTSREMYDMQVSLIGSLTDSLPTSTAADQSARLSEVADGGTCPDGDIEIGADNVSCRYQWTAGLGKVPLIPPPYEAYLSTTQGEGGEDPMDMPEPELTVTDLGAGIIRVAVTVESDDDEEFEDMPSEEEMAELRAERAADPYMVEFAKELEGRAIVLMVTGEEIVETNGSMTADGRTAELVIPLDEFFIQGLPPAIFTDGFYADVRVN